MVRDSNAVKYQQYIKPLAKVGDIAYWDGNTVKTVPLSGWEDSLGTPVGVVVIGENFLPDSKARIISLNNSIESTWGNNNNNSPVPNFNKVPTTDNAGSTTTGGATEGNLPSDRSDLFDWCDIIIPSYVDPKSNYFGFSVMTTLDYLIPSPYLGEEFNPAYVVELDGGNVMSDFNGLNNTQSLVNEGTQYEAAHACWNHKDATNGANGLQWYLPAMGELGFLMTRYELINQSIQAVGGTPVEEGSFWSSSESNSNNGYYLNIFEFGLVCNDIGANHLERYVRSFAIL